MDERRWWLLHTTALNAVIFRSRGHCYPPGLDLLFGAEYDRYRPSSNWLHFTTDRHLGFDTLYWLILDSSESTVPYWQSGVLNHIIPRARTWTPDASTTTRDAARIAHRPCCSRFSSYDSEHISDFLLCLGSCSCFVGISPSIFLWLLMILPTHPQNQPHARHRRVRDARISRQQNPHGQ